MIRFASASGFGRLAGGVAVSVLAMALAAPALAQQGPPGGGTAGAGAAGPVQVGVMTLKTDDIAPTIELPGRVSASQTADVRPQVGGIVKSIDFQPGKHVVAGEVLFELDDATYQAQLDVQSAAIQKAQSAEASAQAKVTRYQQLASTSAVSQSDLLDAQAALAQAKADTATAEANSRAAQLNLSFTKIKAPITGVISTTDVTAGSLVTAAQATALATIRALDPSYVDMVDTSANLLKMRAQIPADAPKGPGNRPPPAEVHLTLEDGEAYGQTGTITSPDVVVSESTGSFSIRATFANPDRILLPGMFVRATVGLGLKQKGFLVPQRAVTFDAAGEATALFAESGKAVSHVLTTNGNSGNNWIVTGGVSDGAQVIVDGLQKVHAGSDVSPVAVTLDDDGVVQSGTATTAAPAASSAAAGAAPAVVAPAAGNTAPAAGAKPAATPAQGE